MSRHALRYVTKRDGREEKFDPYKVRRAIRRTARAVEEKAPSMTATLFAKEVVSELHERYPEGAIHVEAVKDTICDVLHRDMARGSKSHSSEPENLWMAYMLYRDGHLLVENGDLDPDKFNPDTRPMDKIEALRKWNTDHDCHTVDGLNRWFSGRDLRELIVPAEQRSDEELLAVIDLLDARLREGNLKAILMTGPSSSGKTVTTRRAVDLLSKLHPDTRFVPMEVDMYFINNSRSEALYYDVDGQQVKDVNFELPDTYDLPLFNDHLATLLKGGEVLVPRFDFSQGRRTGVSHPLSLSENEVLLIDCMHALYPRLTEAIPPEQKMKIFIEPMVVLEDGAGKPVHLTDVRLMRRLIRDVRTRGYPMKTTLWHWHLVRKGERLILPYVHSADVVVDSGLPYELPMLKPSLEAKLEEINPIFERNPDLFDGRERARRVRSLFSQMQSATEQQTALVPPGSVLREFIGGSVFFEE